MVPLAIAVALAIVAPPAWHAIEMAAWHYGANTDGGTLLVRLSDHRSFETNQTGPFLSTGDCPIDNSQHDVLDCIHLGPANDGVEGIVALSSADTVLRFTVWVRGGPAETFTVHVRVPSGFQGEVGFSVSDSGFSGARERPYIEPHLFSNPYPPTTFSSTSPLPTLLQLALFAGFLAAVWVGHARVSGMFAVLATLATVFEGNSRWYGGPSFLVVALMVLVGAAVALDGWRRSKRNGADTVERPPA